MIRVMSAARRVGRTAGGFLFCEHHIVHVHGMVEHFVGVGKMFSCKSKVRVSFLAIFRENHHFTYGFIKKVLDYFRHHERK